MTSPGPSVLEGVHEMLRETLAQAAGSTRWDGPAWVVRTPELPLVWTLNQVRLAVPLPPRALVRLAATHQGGQGFGHVVVEDGPAARSLAGPLARAGWEPQEALVVVAPALGGPGELAGFSGRGPSAGPARGPEGRGPSAMREDDAAVLMGRWHAEESPGLTSGGLQQILELHRREGSIWPERILGHHDRTGRPLSVVKVRRDRSLAWLEDLYVAPEARGRGAGRALLDAARQTAGALGADQIFALVDAASGPRDLYGAAGFRPIGSVVSFTRDGEPVSPGRLSGRSRWPPRAPAPSRRRTAPG